MWIAAAIAVFFSIVGMELHQELPIPLSSAMMEMIIILMDAVMTVRRLDAKMD